LGSKYQQQHPCANRKSKLDVAIFISGYFSPYAPGSFGHREAHASHGRINPAANSIFSELIAG
jgi:hypothetical protein